MGDLRPELAEDVEPPVFDDVAAHLLNGRRFASLPGKEWCSLGKRPPFLMRTN
jgi:hypothetical protein